MEPRAPHRAQQGHPCHRRARRARHGSATAAHRRKVGGGSQSPASPRGGRRRTAAFPFKRAGAGRDASLLEAHLAPRNGSVLLTAAYALGDHRSSDITVAAASPAAVSASTSRAELPVLECVSVATSALPSPTADELSASSVHKTSVHKDNVLRAPAAPQPRRMLVVARPRNQRASNAAAGRRILIPSNRRGRAPSAPG